MHRPTVGIIALLLGAGAVFYLIRPPEAETIQISLQAAFHRLFLVMAALWLAHPQLSRVPRWAMLLVLAAALVVTGAIMMKSPRSLTLVVPIVIALWATRTWKRAGVR